MERPVRFFQISPVSSAVFVMTTDSPTFKSSSTESSISFFAFTTGIEIELSLYPSSLIVSVFVPFSRTNTPASKNKLNPSSESSYFVLESSL